MLLLLTLAQTLDLLLLLVKLLLHSGHFRNRALHVVLPENLVLAQGLVGEGTCALLLDPLQDRAVLEQVPVYRRGGLLYHFLGDRACEGFDFNLLT